MLPQQHTSSLALLSGPKVFGAKLATMRTLRTNQPPRDTRQVRKAVIKNDSSGYCEPALRDSQFPMNPIAASSR